MSKERAGKVLVALESGVHSNMTRTEFERRCEDARSYCLELGNEERDGEHFRVTLRIERERAVGENRGEGGVGVGLLGHDGS